jgi:hypothetical protein
MCRYFGWLAEVTIFGGAKICQGSRNDSTNNADSCQNGSMQKLISKGRVEIQAGSFEKS